MHHFLVYVYGPEYFDTIEKFNEKLKATLPVRDIDFNLFKMEGRSDIIYDDGEKKILLSINHGRVWYYTTVELNEYDDETRTYTVILNYYADPCYMVNTVTIKYTLLDNDDDLQLVEMECLYNSGYGLAFEGS